MSDLDDLAPREQAGASYVSDGSGRKPPAKRLGWIIVACTVGLILLAVIAGAMWKRGPAEPVESFDAHSLALKAQDGGFCIDHLDRTVEVTGVISSIVRYQTGGADVVIDGGRSGLIECSLRDESDAALSSLRVGNNVTIRGAFSGVPTRVALNRAHLSDKNIEAQPGQ